MPRVSALKEKEQIKTKTGKYEVVGRLTQGSFGAVYRIQKQGLLYAAKIVVDPQRVAQLQQEANVLQSVAGRAHFCALIDIGQKPYPMIMMTLLGPNLAVVRRSMPEGRFSLPTSCQAALQVLSALQTLHAAGFVHGDLKPANCAIGRGVGDRRFGRDQVVLVDFGMCRQFRVDGQLIPPKIRGSFHGTVRYASLNVHLRKEPAARDDLESWFYMLIEFTRGSLPWQELKTLDEIYHWKIHIKTRCGKLITYKFGCPWDFDEIRAYIETLNGRTLPNYLKLQSMIEETMRRNGWLGQKLDWIKHQQLITDTLGDDDSTISVEIEP